MKKCLKYALLSIFLFIGMNIGVEGVKAADPNAVCTYTIREVDNNFLKCSVYDDNVLCEFMGNADVSGVGYSVHHFVNDPTFLTPINFQINNEWKCPKNIYYKYESDTITYEGGSSNDHYYSRFSTTELSGMTSLPLYSETINKTKVSSEKEDIIVCRYGQAVDASYYLYINRTKKSIFIDPHFDPIVEADVRFSYDDLDDKCPNVLYRSIEQKWSYKKNIFGKEVKDKFLGFSYAYSLREESGLDPLNISNIKIFYADMKTPVEVFAEFEQDYIDSCSDLGETIALLKEIYNIMKYLIPILIIGLSIVDFAKVLLSGEEKVYKEAWSKFIKRLIVGIIILILPKLLELIINMSGILNKYGIDGDNIFCIFG